MTQIISLTQPPGFGQPNEQVSAVWKCRQHSGDLFNVKMHPGTHVRLPFARGGKHFMQLERLEKEQHAATDLVSILIHDDRPFPFVNPKDLAARMPMIESLEWYDRRRPVIPRHRFAFEFNVTE
jgi:hypothetical protein